MSSMHLGSEKTLEDEEAHLRLFLFIIIFILDHRIGFRSPIMKQKNPNFINGIVLLSLLVLSIVPISAQNTISVSLTRNFGMGFGGLIQGTFTLTASGSEEIQNLTVYFNGDEVYFTEGNSLSWQFVTDDYPSGSTNITIIGFDSSGTLYSGTTSATFLGTITTNLIIFGIFALVIILVIAKYGPIINRKRKQ